MKIYKLKIGQKLIDSTGFECKITEMMPGKVKVQYTPGKIWTYAQEDFDNGIIKLK